MSNWTDASNELPNYGTRVLCVNEDCIKTGEPPFVAWLDHSERNSEGEFHVWNHINGLASVTHWRLLPEPPKE